jgi:transposase-like protein
VVGLRGFKLNPLLMTYFTDKPPPRQSRRRARPRERRVSKRLGAETIERVVAEYVAGASSAELGRRYGIAKSSVLKLIQQAGEPVRYSRLTADETARLVDLYKAGMSQRDIAELLGRKPSVVWHCLRQLGLV